ncbi:hypothetical protein CORC01_14429 [Colletotrichum orchidophilum]|uniref:Cyanovirin-N domain-containing protein n=1 Tax=Colletotrichum orchidophilum TaxID=1209926 RepID=A0A1G4AM60_9PEZI|nr:uncharacterized protein CORC01_14429 [Colletotrichum orchidophilum]OHE90270.1 hypothetical protein CORC01_14429 [Colletotrichum orchidophilum]
MREKLKVAKRTGRRAEPETTRIEQFLTAVEAGRNISFPTSTKTPRIPKWVHSRYCYHQISAMASPVVRVLGHLAVLCSVLHHVSGEQHADQLAERETSLQPRGFLGSCVDWGTLMNEKYKMAAFCRTTTGGWTWSVLDLNHCMVNHDGSLMAQDE